MFICNDFQQVEPGWVQLAVLLDPLKIQKSDTLYTKFFLQCHLIKTV